jgi:hypothetical protein
MAISTGPRPAITHPPIAPLPATSPTAQPMTQTAHPWADGSTALFIDHVAKRSKKDKVAAEHDLPATLESVFMTWTERPLDDVEDEEND